MGGSSQPPLCDEGLDCQPTAPAGWLGPVAYWQGPNGDEPPECPDGYAEPIDLHADPEGAPADCACTCTARDLKCGTTDEVTIYNDLGCANVCGTTGPRECGPAPVSGCSGNRVSIDVPRRQPTGRCVAAVEPTVTTARWKRDARFCELKVDVDECGDGGACFPTPSGGFSSQLCVYRVVLAGKPAPECPNEYPNQELLYDSFEDERGCGECECAGPMGGSCTGEVILSTDSDCSTVVDRYVIGKDECLEIAKPSHIAVEYVRAGGTCSVGTEPEPTGDVVPSGNYHAVCCQ